MAWLLFPMHRMCVRERFGCINNGIIYPSIVLSLFREAEMSSVIFLPEEAACPFRLTAETLHAVKLPLSVALPRQSVPHAS